MSSEKNSWKSSIDFPSFLRICQRNDLFYDFSIVRQFDSSAIGDNRTYTYQNVSSVQSAHFV